ncbi:MAG: DNA primase [Desulfopila sp.]|jgi:DNA primase|nr:DNA primase [Desulfopila sp.]
MGFIETRQDITASIKEQTDIVKIIGECVDLKRSGVRYLGLCPFHGEKTPSFSVHGDQQFFHCFGCGESGDVFSFLMKYYNYDFPTALKLLADRLNIELPQKTESRREKEEKEKRRLMYGVTEKAAAMYRQCLVDDTTGRAARHYLAERGIPLDIQDKFNIGYAPAVENAGWNYLGSRLSHEDSQVALQVGLLVQKEGGATYDRFRDRILFPLYDTQGRICGFGGRIVGEGQPKYMNSPESSIFNKSRILLGLYQQQEEIRKKRKAVIVEGNFDMISLVVNGCSHVVAPLGTALTSAQIRLLTRYVEEAVLLFDGDDAGVKAALRAAPLFLAENLNARVAVLPKGHDPDTFVRQNGIKSLGILLDDAEELTEFVLEKLIQEHGLTLGGKSRIAEEIKPLVAAASSSLQRSVIISHFAEKLGIEPERLEHSLGASEEAVFIPPAPQQVHRKSGGEVQPLSAAQKRLVEFMIMNPQFFRELEEKNLREILQGGVGEIVFLQLQMMLKEKSEVQPEDLFSALPEGPEKTLVGKILIKAPQSAALSQGKKHAQDSGKEELGELLDWLDIQHKRNISNALTVKIEEAQRENDFAALEKLLNQKQHIEKEMRNSRG